MSNLIISKKININNLNALKHTIDEPDFVFHLAAQAIVKKSYIDPEETWKFIRKYEFTRSN